MLILCGITYLTEAFLRPRSLDKTAM